MVRNGSRLLHRQGSGSFSWFEFCFFFFLNVKRFSLSFLKLLSVAGCPKAVEYGRNCKSQSVLF
ncbi:mCG1044484 [Mus musculus]|nr:mCG1044484 [Mus musculus]